MNLAFAKEVGLLRYLGRRLLWRMGPPPSMDLHTNVSFPIPRDKFFASDVFVTEGNVDWNSEYILAAFLKASSGKGEFIDIGAHIGYYSCLLSPFVSKVFAFEPDVRNHKYLRVALANLNSAELIDKAVSDSVSKVVFCDEGESSISHLDLSAKTGTFVSVTTVDAFVQERGISPSAIKIDIEGFDILALRGALQTAGTHEPVFLVEYNQEENRPNTWQGLEDFVNESNYRVYAVSRKSKNLFGYDYTFSERSVNELPALEIKMIFLVSEKNSPWFAHFSQMNGKWGNEALQPASIRALLEKY